MFDTLIRPTWTSDAQARIKTQMHRLEVCSNQELLLCAASVILGVIAEGGRQYLNADEEAIRLVINKRIRDRLDPHE